MIKQISTTYSKKDKILFVNTDDKEMEWIGSFDCEKYNRIFLIFDKNVHKIWGKQILGKLKNQKKECFSHQVDPVENSKSVNYYFKVVDFFEKNKCNRYDLVIAVGGGIVIDLVSFVCSIYMRGLPLYFIPTTVVGQIDASTAGKTCLNSKKNKNLLGTFYYPLVVYNNISFLKTNSPYYLRQGFSEIFKYGLLNSKSLLKKMERYQENKSDKELFEIIIKSIKARSTIRKRDPLASNLGHTFGHAIEKTSNYKILHGDAITVGTVLALHFANQEGLISRESVDSIISMMKKLQLNIYLDENLNIEKLVDFMMHDKKSSIHSLNLVLIQDIAQPYEKKGNYFYETSPATVKKFLKDFIKNYEYSVKNCAKFINKDNLVY